MGGVPNYPVRVPRKHPRARLVTQVESRASGLTSIGRTDNISEGGVLVLSRDTFDPLTEVIVRFNLPGGKPVQAQGLVVHTEANVRMGIQFVELSDEGRESIAAFVQQACA